MKSKNTIGSRSKPAAHVIVQVPHSCLSKAGYSSPQYIEARYNRRVPPLSPQVFHILVALADRDQHGYGIMQDVAERTGGKLRLSAGTLYGSIKRLLEQGLVIEVRERERPHTPDDDARRRYYRLTKLGRKTAEAEAARMSELIEQARVNGLVAKRS